MFKKDLTKGMVFVTRKGNVRLITEAGVVKLGNGEVVCSGLYMYDDALNHVNSAEHDIVEVYSDFTMTNLIWERPVVTGPVLDDAEAEYLGNVIKPFKKRVYGIVKCSKNGFHYIDIRLYSALRDGKKSRISLPYFLPNVMYRGMEVDKTYSVEELGL